MLFRSQAAVSKALVDAEIDVAKNVKSCVTHLSASLNDFRALTNLTLETYESMTDVPAWNPVRSLPCPYHWSDVLPLYETEFKEIVDQLKKKTDDLTGFEMLAAAAYLEGYSVPGMDTAVSDATGSLILPLVAACQRQLAEPAHLDTQRRSIRSRLLEYCGIKTLAERAPLNARTTGRLEYPKYVLEKVIYEAWPGIPVSAHLYLPKGDTAPLPCVL